jgi:hypothetical protein
MKPLFSLFILVSIVGVSCSKGDSVKVDPAVQKEKNAAQSDSVIAVTDTFMGLQNSIARGDMFNDSVGRLATMYVTHIGKRNLIGISGTMMDTIGTENRIGMGQFSYPFASNPSGSYYERQSDTFIYATVTRDSIYINIQTEVDCFDYVYQTFAGKKIN